MSKREEKYERLEPLGRGGMGVVYKALDRDTNRLVAIKYIPEDFRDDQEVRERFHQEAVQQAKILHENVAILYDHFIENDQAVIVLEFINGCSLDAYMKRHGPLSVEESLRIIGGALAGLDAAHTARVIHRDLKPSNIMLQQQPEGQTSSPPKVKLVDFGLARSTERGHSGSTAVMGTPLYMSPEQIRGIKADEKTDIYSLGATLYHMMTGRPPFLNEEVVAIIAAHVNEKPRSPRSLNPSIPRHVDAAIMKALEKKPQDRHQSALEFAAALSAAQSTAPSRTLSHSETLLEQRGSRSPRKTVDTLSQDPPIEEGPSQLPVYISIAALLLVIAGIATFLLYPRHKDEDHTSHSEVHVPLQEQPAPSVGQSRKPEQHHSSADTPQTGGKQSETGAMSAKPINGKPDPVPPPAPVVKTVAASAGHRDFSGSWSGVYSDTEGNGTPVKLKMTESGDRSLKGNLTFKDDQGNDVACGIANNASGFVPFGDTSTGELTITLSGCPVGHPKVLNFPARFDDVSPTASKLDRGLVSYKQGSTLTGTVEIHRD